MNYENKYDYKASELKKDNKTYYNICNEYGINLGSTRRKTEDVFDKALKLKHFTNKTSK